MSWLHRTDKIYIPSRSPADMAALYGDTFVDGTGQAASNVNWIWNPDLSAVGGFESKYWIITGDIVTLMNQTERDAVDAAAAAAIVSSNRTLAIGKTTEETDVGIAVRELIELFNKRDNYLVNRIAELQAAFNAVKATSGPADNIRAAIPASWLATNTRTRAAAIQDYTDDINAGNADA